MTLPPFPRLALTPRRWATFFAHCLKATCKQHHTELLPALTKVLPRDGVVFDVGAHAGQFAKLFARMAPLGTVYSFEPGRYARSVLMIALGLNRAVNVRLFPFGFSDKAARLELSVPIKKSGSFGFGLSHLGASHDNRAAETEVVELVTMDSFCAAFPVDRIDLIKADIEGWEMRMLAGGVQTLARFRPALWIELVDGHLGRAGDSLASFWQFLIDQRYVPHAVTDDGSFTVISIPREGDILWLPAEKTH